jgi:hypothetical protein
VRKEILATLLISAYWIIAGFLVAYSAWDRGFMAAGTGTFQSTLPDPYGLGIILAAAGLIFSFVVLRTLLPSRATQRHRLMRLLDDIGVDEVEAIQQRLAALPDEPDEMERAASLRHAASLRALLQEEKRKNRAD